ncbi:Zinc finger, RING-type [Kalmanozyma brasiliensis GHG001]|uniref:Zinc finger, RING-type n=1 Tax=Kalmanozyma brasiliensis (strain GHG001) TaxID=1365824 RepID=UPI001CEAAEE5|nr:Zinc finger, RING-type [Kalmanozyma brasiliensis GHG001]KAF6767610.1 Zinc finger, RING-type [Kalmanozyma brasiliensis GHG001]
MPEASDAGPSSGASASQRTATSPAMSRRRSSGTRSSRSRPVRSRATSSMSQRSEGSNMSSGIQQLSWTTGDCFNYVDDDTRISAFLHCPICLGPFLEPYASNVCAHTFCKQCITTAITSQTEGEDGADAVVAAAAKRCPTCRTAVDLADFQPTALLIKNMVDTLRVRCPNKSKGCDYECERHLLRGHVASECAFEYVDQNQTEGKRCGCSAKVMRKDWASHGLVCPKRRIACPTCDAGLCADELEVHQETCSPEPAVCEHCDLSTIKSRLAAHIADECQDAPVLCPHSAFGCVWKGPRHRLSSNPDTASKSTAQTHLENECRFEPIKAFFSVFTQHVHSLTDENAALKAKLDEMEARQHGSARRIDDCIHSLGSWYRSAGELRAAGLDPRARGSQVGVDGEWDEFPLDAQNWERSLSQQSFGMRQARTQSASAISSMDLATWARRQYTDLSPADLSRSQQPHRPSSTTQAAMPEEAPARYLAPPTARSMPNSTSALGGSPSPSRERASYLSPTDTTRRSLLTPLDSSVATSLSPVGYNFPPIPPPHPENDPMDSRNLDAALSSLTASVAGLSSGLSSLDKRTEEGHIAAVKAGFDAGRVQEEVASLRHGLHAVRMQIHQILMQQQRHALFPSSGYAAAAAGPVGTAAMGNDGAGPSVMPNGGLPMLSPPLMRRWAGLEHTKL